MGDVSFDGIANEFESDIYGSTKGAVRLAVLWSVLNDDVPALTDQPMRILDAGGGSGHMAVRLASLGCSYGCQIGSCCVVSHCWYWVAS